MCLQAKLNFRNLFEQTEFKLSFRCNRLNQNANNNGATNNASHAILIIIIINFGESIKGDYVIKQEN